MQFFLTATDDDPAEPWLSRGVADGLVLKPGHRPAGYDPTNLPVLRELAGPDPALWPTDARRGADGDREVLDLDLLDPDPGDTLITVHRLAEAGTAVSVRSCLSVGQVLLCWRAGARYARLRWSDIVADGGDPIRVISNCTQWGGLRRPDQLLLVDALDTAGDFYDALRSTADGLVVTGSVLDSLLTGRRGGPRSTPEAAR